ncbi:hypothetical protein J4459_02730 [Candidatus Woesearchaeota archaeon]|nr:hypothetical protein [Candidatus Woesearchaeota archaeon]
MNEELNRTKFDEGISIVLNNIFEKDEGVVLGFETEYHLVDENLNPGHQDVVETLVKVGRELELGGHQIELNGDKIKGNNLNKIYSFLKNREESLVVDLSKKGLRILRIGALPNLQPSDLVVGNKEKYLIVPAYHDKNRDPDVDTIIGEVNFNCAKSVGLFSSIQLNVQAKSLEDGIDKLNRSLMIGPYIAAISGNARIIANKDTGYSDVRMVAWNKSHQLKRRSDFETEERVGLPNKFYSDIKDYISRMRERPFIYDLSSADPLKAVAVGVGLNWRDTRLKFIQEDNLFRPVVEFRLPSLQPSLDEDLSVLLFYLGRVEWSQMNNEELFTRYKFNRSEALRLGLDGMMYDGMKLVTKIKPLIEREISRAEDGLVNLGFSRNECKDYLDILRARNECPSKRFVREISEEGLENAMKKYLI